MEKTKLTLSASQLKTFTQCKRKHWIEKVYGCRFPSGKGAERGSKLHDLVANCLLGNTTYEELVASRDSSDDLRHGIRSLDTAGHIKDLVVFSKHNLFVEEKVVINDYFLGYIDLFYIDENTGELVIIDHKFTANPKYVPSEEDLLEAEQTVAYSFALLNFFKDIDSVTFKYHYYGTAWCWHKEVKLTLSRERAEKSWRKIEKKALQVATSYSKTTMDEVAPNFYACDSYGGCPFREVCRKRGEEAVTQLEALMKQAKLNKSGVSGTPEQATLSEDLTSSIEQSATTPVTLLRGVNSPEVTAATISVVQDAVDPAEGMDITGTIEVEAEPIDVLTEDIDNEGQVIEAEESVAPQATPLTELAFDLLVMDNGINFLSNRTINALNAAGFRCLEDMRGLSYREVMANKGVGSNAIDELKLLFSKKGIDGILVKRKRRSDAKVEQEVIRTPMTQEECDDVMAQNPIVEDEPEESETIEPDIGADTITLTATKKMLITGYNLYVRGLTPVPFEIAYKEHMQAIAQAKEKAHISLIRYNEGWQILAARIMEEGWPEGIETLIVPQNLHQDVYMALSQCADIVIGS